jgi:hypothetical protein
MMAEEGYLTCLEHSFLLHSAMLHDVCDHKYPNSIQKDELSAFILESTRSKKMA